MPFNLKIEDKYNKFSNIKLVPPDISNIIPLNMLSNIPYDISTDLSHNNIEYIYAFNWYKPNMNDNDNISDFKNSDTDSCSDTDLNDNPFVCEENNYFSYDIKTKDNSHRNSLCPYSCKLC